MDDQLEREAAALFRRTRDGMGWGDPEWSELAEETRQMYRVEALRRRALQEPVDHG